MKTLTARAWVLVGAAVLLTMWVPTWGQEAASDAGVLTSLLTEVRGLRLAMERMAVTGPRIQLAMGRLQMQEQRVDAMQRRLDVLRDRIEAAERGAAEGQEGAARMEQMAEHAQDPAERQALESQAEQFKAMAARTAREVQRLRNEEAELAGLVASEQGRWMEFNRRLDDLEREMIRQ